MSWRPVARDIGLALGVLLCLALWAGAWIALDRFPNVW